ncbi:hypothetical protein V9T40_001324 [Parthenolecanium corni]|uniref:EF-hand domain-containing protein n=1 Tax=Parthenolecanium corni TaxID=536013 RepID=A0AAN9TBC7_9HEMI
MFRRPVLLLVLFNDKEKIKKKKIRKEEKDEPSTPEPELAAPHRSSLHHSTKSSKKAVKRSGSNVFSMFSPQQVTEFKEGFALMDKDKDGILGKEDLRATWDQVGKLVSDKDLQEMLHEAPGPVNFTQLLSLFANRMAGGADDDQTIREAFLTFDENGHIDTQKLKHALVTWGDKFSAKEVADALDCMEVNSRGFVDTEGLVQMLTAGGDEE